MSKLMFVTGVNGFVGQHVAKNLQSHEYKVVGIGRENVASSKAKAYLHHYISCDLADEDSVKNIKPDLQNAFAVVNLAGIATTSNDPERTKTLLRINTNVHTFMYKALYDIGSSARVLAISTGLVYDPSQPTPFIEASKLLQDTPTTNTYVRSKLRVENIAKEYRSKGLDIITLRPFNHTGPGQGLGFFVPDQISKIRSAKKSGMRMDIGDGLDFWRDFTDVRDVVEAYRLLATLERKKITSTTYNVASGTSIFGRDLFRLIASELQFTSFNLTTSTSDPSTPLFTGCRDLLTADTGWKPTKPIQETIQDQL